MASIDKKLSFLPPDLREEMITYGRHRIVEPKTDLIRADQYIKMLPIILSGLIKVYSRFEEKDLLLYYIQAEESCVMSFHAILNNESSKIYAVAEDTSEALLLPADQVVIWTKKYPAFAQLFFDQYHLRYADLLENIKHLLIDRMDKRLYDYLYRKYQIDHQPIQLNHKEIANDLGTAREVISRILKKLELEGKIQQNSSGIYISSTT